MSNLKGHDRLTARAVNELRSECSTHPLLSGLGDAGLPIDVVMRDLMDVLILGHWADFGQAHHFMRRFDGQSPYQAYEEGVEWIRGNSIQAASQISSQMRSWFPAREWSSGVSSSASYRSQCVAPELVVHRRNDPRGALVFSRSVQGNWQTFGNAIHALEDSFARGHVDREDGQSAERAGPIRHIRRYAGAEREGHEHFDELWFDSSTNRFSRDGLLAIAAVKELILMVCTTAIRARGQTPSLLVGWSEFSSTWLAASAGLSRTRDGDFDFVDRFTTTIRLGDSSVTVNCDEEGMAEAMIREFGTNTARVLQVFRRLKQHNITDWDEIACEYVKRVRQRGDPLADALRHDPALLDLLERAMHMTDSEQASCIVYLTNLRRR